MHDGDLVSASWEGNGRIAVKSRMHDGELVSASWEGDGRIAVKS